MLLQKSSSQQQGYGAGQRYVKSYEIGTKVQFFVGHTHKAKVNCVVAHSCQILMAMSY